MVLPGADGPVEIPENTRRLLGMDDVGLIDPPEDATAGKYYVYYLAIDGRVFYVGKGQTTRIYGHRWHARRGTKGPLYDHLRSILASGRKWQWGKFADGIDAKSALQIEGECILAFARKSDGGQLFNLSLGGGASLPMKPHLVAQLKARIGPLHHRYGKKQTPEWIAQMHEWSARVSKKTVAEGILYRSRAEAARSLGITLDCLIKRMKSKSLRFSNYYDASKQ